MEDVRNSLCLELGRHVRVKWAVSSMNTAPLQGQNGPQNSLNAGNRRFGELVPQRSPRRQGNAEWVGLWLSCPSMYQSTSFFMCVHGEESGSV